MRSHHSIVMKFLSFRTKELLLTKALKKKGFAWIGKQISLGHNHRPLTLKTLKEHTEERKTVEENQIQFQILCPARLKVKYTDWAKTYNTVEEATEDMSRRGYLVKVIKTPRNNPGPTEAAHLEQSGQRGRQQDSKPRTRPWPQGETLSLQEGYSCFSKKLRFTKWLVTVGCYHLFFFKKTWTCRYFGLLVSIVK